MGDSTTTKLGSLHLTSFSESSSLGLSLGAVHSPSDSTFVSAPAINRDFQMKPGKPTYFITLFSPKHVGGSDSQIYGRGIGMDEKLTKLEDVIIPTDRECPFRKMHHPSSLVDAPATEPVIPFKEITLKF